MFDSEYINFKGTRAAYHTFAVSPDGQRFLIPRPERDTLVVLDREGSSRTLDTDNWTAPKISPDGKRVRRDQEHSEAFGSSISRAAIARQIDALNDPQDFRAVGRLVSRREQRSPTLAIDLDSGNDVLYLANASGAPERRVSRARSQGSRRTARSASRAMATRCSIFRRRLARRHALALPLVDDCGARRARARHHGHAGPAPVAGWPAFRVPHEQGQQERDLGPSASATPVSLGLPVRVGDGLGMTAWRADGAELYYVSLKREFMSASVRTASTLTVGEPRRLFDMPKAIPVAAGFDGRGDVSADGGAVVVQVPPRIPPPAQTEMRVVDRAGKVVATPGKPGTFFGRPMISPDGTKVGRPASPSSSRTSSSFGSTTSRRARTSD